MKYLITDSEFTPQIVMGYDIFHADLRKAFYSERARLSGGGHFEVKDGLVRTYGKSEGLNIYPAQRDASLIAAYLGIGYDKVHPDSEFRTAPIV